MEEEKVQEVEKNQKNEKTKVKKPLNKFIIKYIIFVIILILVTAIAIYFTIQKINNTQILVEPNEESSDEKITEETRKVAEDSKYAVNSYAETYNTNSLEIKKYYDIDGKIGKEEKYSGYGTKIGFIQIEGLKNKDIQDKINAKLKNVPYTVEKEKSVWSYVTANFSNVLSVEIVNDLTSSYTYGAKTLNFDLTTGEEISFEKIFVSSAPIKSMIAAGMYENFAWDILYEDYEKYEGFYDMKNADTSEIEEQMLVAVNKYDKIKDEIIFSFSPTGVTIYNPELSSTIDMVEYANEIAIYKRYLTEESIYENDDLGIKGIIVFTNPIGSDSGAESISYGKITNNIFVEEVLWKLDNLENEEMSMISKYVKKLSEEQKIILKQEIANDRGAIFQREYNVSKYEDKGYYCISVYSYKAECSRSYFEDQAFKDYIKVNALPRSAPGSNAFTSYMQEDYPEMQISDEEYKEYYISLTGEFLGHTKEEVESKIWE